MSRDARALFESFELGPIRLANRIVMAPLTRSRALEETSAPHGLNAEYYAQRASAGLIVSEATNITPEGKGYAFTPGIFSQDQVEGWRLVTRSVHAAGSKILLQLWHVGRISHPSLQPGGQLPVAPSAIAPDGEATAFTEDGIKPIGTPRALRADELPRLVADYRTAAKNAIAAGFDGVEIHAANAYLLDQFLRPGANHRTDEYGGSPENRRRFPLMVVDGVIAEVGADRTGIRISPVNKLYGLDDAEAKETFMPFVAELSKRRLAYVHLIEGTTRGPRDSTLDFQALRREFVGAWMVNNGYTRDLAIDAVESGYADLVCFGRAFIGNPDLAARLRDDLPIVGSNEDTWYGGGADGYTSYPRAAETAVAR